MMQLKGILMWLTPAICAGGAVTLLLLGIENGWGWLIVAAIWTSLIASDG